MPRTFAQIADQFRFVLPINVHEAIRIVQAWIDTADNADDDKSRLTVKPVPLDFECDGCGGRPDKWVVDHIHPEGGSVIGNCCWFA